MSGIPTKQIDGDIAIGRHASIGGNANVQGNARVGHNLRVDGWLDARNLKVPCKGVYRTATQLVGAYPRPETGWWAYVQEYAGSGATGDGYLGQVYVSSGGEWAAQYNGDGSPRLGGNPAIDGSAVLDTTLQEMERKLKEIAGGLERLSGELTQAQRDIDGFETSQRDQDRILTELTESKGKSNGIAPLDETTRVPLKHLPGRVDNVVEFLAIVEGVEVSEGMSRHYSGDEGCIVVYDKTKQSFLLGQLKMGQAETEEMTEGDTGTGVTPGGNVDPGGKVDPENPWIVDMIDLSKYNFFPSWMDCVSYGTYTANGRKPEGGKIYICQTEGKLYWWNGLSPVQTGGGGVIGG